MTLSTLVTAEELFASPTSETRCELVNGEVIPMAPAGGEHGMVTVRLTVPLAAFVNQHRLGVCVAAETGFILSRDPDTVRAPDFAFIPRDQIPPEGLPAKFLTLVPALVVEVLSPSDQAMQVDEKIAAWLQFGVAQVWVANPRVKTVTIYSRQGDVRVHREHDTLDGGDVLPGLALPVQSLFQ